MVSLNLLRNLAEASNSDSDILNVIKTPEDLSLYMKSINYGWIDKKGKRNGTGDDDDEEYFYKEYSLQSPEDLIKSRLGVCWDQAELERKWFKLHKYQYAVIYVEVVNDESAPTHTFLIYKDPNNNEICWFENSWGQYRGIHKYSTVNKCVNDVVNKLKQSFNLRGTLLVTKLGSVMSGGMSCSGYYSKARKGDKIELTKISDEILD